MKTNGARFLESLGIPFELREYEVDPEDLSAITVAKKIGMPPEQVFKTLLVMGGPNIYRFAVVPGDAELDFKKLARAAGLRKAEMAPLKDVQPLTGYIRGGVTLFGSRKAFPVYIDETAILFDKISVSAGTRGTQLILSSRRLSEGRSRTRCRSPNRGHRQRRPKVDRGGTREVTLVLFKPTRRYLALFRPIPTCHPERSTPGAPRTTCRSRAKRSEGSAFLANSSPGAPSMPTASPRQWTENHDPQSPGAA